MVAALLSTTLRLHLRRLRKIRPRVGGESSPGRNCRGCQV